MRLSERRLLLDILFQLVEMLVRKYQRYRLLRARLAMAFQIDLLEQWLLMKFGLRCEKANRHLPFRHASLFQGSKGRVCIHDDQKKWLVRSIYYSPETMGQSLTLEGSNRRAICT